MSELSQRHTIEDLEAIVRGGTSQQIRAALAQEKGGLNPVHLAVLLSAIQSGRLLELLDAWQSEEASPTQRIEQLLEAMVASLERIELRLSALESGTRSQPVL